MGVVSKSILWASLITLLLALLIVVGSRSLTHFDAALVGYTFAVLFAVFAIAYRYSMWLQRPSTAMYWKRGWQIFLQPRYITVNLIHAFQRIISDFALNRYIFRRGKVRGGAHLLIMWGCLVASIITFPLVFGWLHFETISNNLNWYCVFVFGFPTIRFEVSSIFGFVVFHGLVWSSFLVISGVMIAMWRRMRDHGAAATQQFVEDFLPLILLFTISITGLMLTASYTWMKGYGYDFLSILHAISVIFTLLWLPFGKLFHIFQRPAQLGVSFYKEISKREKPACCRRCNTPFTSLLHLQDLIQVEHELGYDYKVNDSSIEHYQWICPRCRRAMLVIEQGKLWQGQQNLHLLPLQTLPQSSLGNPGIGFGPLSEEDKYNFHL